MKTTITNAFSAVIVFALFAFIGCSDANEPATTTVGEAALTTENVVNQDLSQLSGVGIPGTPSYGVFSIGWNQFVGPAIQNTGTIGKAFAVIHEEIPQTGTRPTSIDIGSVSLSYTGGATDLAKHTAPNGNVMYSTFERGLRTPQTLPVNIPFVGGGTYTFSASGTASFPQGLFSVTAPAALLDITNTNGDAISASSDLTIAWTGGNSTGEVVVRVVPHLAPPQLQQPIGGGQGPRGPGHGPGGNPPPGMGQGPHQGPGGPMGPGAGMNPALGKAITKKVTNTGTITITATELQDLLTGTTADELMVNVAQVVENVVTHNTKTYTVLLKDGDRVVLKLQ